MYSLNNIIIDYRKLSNVTRYFTCVIIPRHMMYAIVLLAYQTTFDFIRVMISCCTVASRPCLERC